jgi:hypothetical protein
MTEYISSQHLPQSPFPSTTPLLGETAPHAILAGGFVFGIVFCVHKFGLRTAVWRYEVLASGYPTFSYVLPSRICVKVKKLRL